MKIIISSIAGITLCCLCLVSLTWAWFEDSSHSGRNSISSATFWSEVMIEKVSTDTNNASLTDDTDEADDAEVTPADEALEGEEKLSLNEQVNSKILMSATVSTLSVSNSPAVIDGTNYISATPFKLEGACLLQNFEAGKYKITVSPRGTATKFGGYLVIKATDNVSALTEQFYTEQLTIGKEFVFTFEIEDGVKYSISCIWGSLPPSIEKENIIKNELEENKSDESPKASSATSSEESEDVSSDEQADFSNTSSIESDVTSSTESEVTSSVESEVVSSAESEVTSSTESDVTSSTESNVVSSTESEVASSQESENPSSQADFENSTSEETSSEV